MFFIVLFSGSFYFDLSFELGLKLLFYFDYAYLNVIVWHYGELNSAEDVLFFIYAPLGDVSQVRGQ